MAEIEIIPILNDNYAYAVVSGDEVVVVDPGEAGPVLDFLEGKRLAAILLTHHHDDHVDGVSEIREKHPCTVVAPKDERISGVDEVATEGKLVTFLGLDITPFSTPGHTRSEITYYIPKLFAAFTGDTLFSGGCGRLFEGTAEDMHTSLQKIAALPDETKLYFGHEYTEGNLLFAHAVDPENEAITNALTHLSDITTPTTVGREKEINLFLRAKTAEELGELRKRKNRET